MIERIMLLRLAENIRRDAVAERIRRSLDGLPGLESLSVGVPADATSAKSWDVSVIMGFRDLGSLEAGVAAEPYQALMERELADSCQVVKAWSFARV